MRKLIPIEKILRRSLVAIFVLSLFACADKSGESDLNPSMPSGVADQENEEGGGTVKDTLLFPSFEDGVRAFPGAEGYGRNATGAGSKGEIYHVTNLDDSGKGSFRDAVSQPFRIVVFDVAGVIRLSTTAVVLKSNQTILGQTAPGDGVVLYGGRLSASGATNTIVRYLRIRMGAGYPSQADASGIANGSNVIFDHCSITWGKDENFSINGDGKGVNPQNITIQNSIIGQGLENHSCGGLIQTGITEGITIFRNLYIDNESRNPKVKGLNQFVNNVLYNWGSGAAYNMGGDSDGPSETTIENNYMIVGLGHDYYDDGTGATVLRSMSPAKPYIGGNGLFRTYFSGNYYDKNKNGILDGAPIDWDNDCSGSPTFLATKSELHPTIMSQTSAIEAYNWVVKNVGASLPARDQVDKYLIDELLSLGTKGTIIRNETKTEQFPLGGPGTFATGHKPLDSDNDGMPDEFEDTWQSDKTNPADATRKASNGYTFIENYAFSLEYPEKYQMQLDEYKNRPR